MAVSAKPEPSKNVEYVENFIERFKHFFDAAAYVVVERQMRCNMRIIEALLEQRFKIISLRSVKAHYALGMRNHTQNKAAAVGFASQFVANPDAVLCANPNAVLCANPDARSTANPDAFDRQPRQPRSRRPGPRRGAQSRSGNAICMRGVVVYSYQAATAGCHTGVHEASERLLST